MESNECKSSSDVPWCSCLSLILSSALSLSSIHLFLLVKTRIYAGRCDLGVECYSGDRQPLRRMQEDIFSCIRSLRVKGAAPSDQPIHADAKGAFNALIVKAEQHHAAAGR